MRSGRSGFPPDGELKRHELYDHPMPSNAREQIEAYSPSLATPTGPHPDPLTPTPSRHIGFAPDVVEHRYGTGNAPPGTAQHFEHHNVDGPSRLRFGGAMPGQGLPSNPRALKVDTAVSDLGTATITSPSTFQRYHDPYAPPTTDGPQHMAAVASLSGKLSQFSSPAPDLHLDDPRQRDRARTRTSSIGAVSGMFSPRRRAEANAEPEEVEGLVGRHRDSGSQGNTDSARDSMQDDDADAQYASVRHHDARYGSHDTLNGSVESLT